MTDPTAGGADEGMARTGSVRGVRQRGPVVPLLSATPVLAQTDLVPRIPLGAWAEAVVAWVTETFQGAFDVLKDGLGFLITSLEVALTTPHPFLVIALIATVAWRMGGWNVALTSLVGLLLLVSLGLWEAAMLTLALVLAAGAISLALGIPIGVLAAQFRSVEAVVRPLLDVMQTMPSFVYLIPMVLLLGLGNVPALIATLVFAMPPAIRLTMLGIRHVPRANVEAAQAFGATRWQTLVKVELPLAMPSVMAGVNQVIMLSLSMVVIAALIGAGGLGAEVVRGLAQLDVGRGFVGGVGIVILALVLDRITRDVGRQEGHRRRREFRFRRHARTQAIPES